MKPTTQPRTDGGGVPSKNTTLPEAISGVKCFGCGKMKKIVTHNNLKQQGFCQRCNMRLIRKFGPKYGQVLADPKAALEGLDERKEEKSDLKLVRRTFFTLLTLMEEHDLAHAVHLHGSSYACIHFHLVHLPGVP
jgi:hypothetical protein